MENFKASVMAVCVVSAVICIIENIVTGTRLKEQMRLLLNLFMILTAVAPFIGDTPKVELSDAEASSPLQFQAGEIYSEELRRQTSYNISSVLLEQLKAGGIGCTKIETDVNISDDGSISINRVTVAADDFERASSIIKSAIGTETEVINENSR